jgi:hypothetical protein
MHDDLLNKSGLLKETTVLFLIFKEQKQWDFFQVGLKLLKDS